MLLMLAACAKEETSEPTPENSKQVAEQPEQANKKEESKYPFPEGTQATGIATITVSTPAGSSEGGNVPVLFVEKDSLMQQIGMDLANFDGSKQTFIYLDKIFVNTEQVVELTQTSLTLEQKDGLKPGIHTVTAVQFEGDDPTAAVTTYTETQFESKEAK